MDRFRRQLVLASTTVVLVIVLGAVTGLIALHSAGVAQTKAQTIDRQLLLIERARDIAQEIASSARRYMTSGDQMEELRVHSLLDDLRQDQKKLAARFTVPNGPALDADLDAYQLGIFDAMSDFQPDPVERLNRFEDRLARIRLPLSATFDDLIAHERTRRSTLRSAVTLSRSAQWTLLLASLIGVMLAIGICVAVLRQLSALGSTTFGSSQLASTDERSEPAVLR